MSDAPIKDAPIPFDDKVLAERIAVQRNKAMNDLAAAEAAVVTLRAQLAEKDKEIAALKQPPEPQ